ncbi:MAG TPA: DUF202 domain-containing protein [Solirubrobacteraceae bacterium]|nr:DUF202 domain-containing protein [Solirubrobacteraceae bacterium]
MSFGSPTGTDPAAPPRGPDHDPGLAGDRTVLAWTRTSLSLAGIGVLTARAALVEHLWVLGILVGLLMAVTSFLAYVYALRLYPDRRLPATRRHHQAEAFRVLTLTASASAVVAGIVTLISA